MRIGYFIRNTGLSGGVKVILQHVRLLDELGHDALLLTNRIVDEWAKVPANTVIVKDDLGDLPACDLYVATVARDVRTLYEKKGGLRVVHLCQSYEPEDYRARLAGESHTDKYRAKGIFSFFKRADNARHFRKRIRGYRAVYGLPTIKMAVSRHLAQIIERKHGQRCHLVQNGVDGTVFHPKAGVGRLAGPGPARILSVGSMRVGAKGIPDALEAIGILKDRGCSVELTRVSPDPPSEEEKRSRVTDRLLTALNEEEMADLYRESDVFLSTSLESEGFGLPAIDALSSGVPCVLTGISTYRNFAPDRDFACFVPVHRPDAVADAIEALVRDEALRERCVARGLEVAKNFSLERTKEHLAAFVESISGQ